MVCFIVLCTGARVLYPIRGRKWGFQGPGLEGLIGIMILYPRNSFDLLYRTSDRSLKSIWRNFSHSQSRITSEAISGLCENISPETCTNTENLANFDLSGRQLALHLPKGTSFSLDLLPAELGTHSICTIVLNLLRSRLVEKKLTPSLDNSGLKSWSNSVLLPSATLPYERE